MRGRPLGSEAQLRPQLLDAALRCFARHGIVGASTRAIAREAGVTSALLHYYFGDRAQLLQAVIDERLLPTFFTLRDALHESGDDLRTIVHGFVHALMRTIQANPWLPSLWVREVLCEGGALRDLLVDVIGPQLPRALATRFAEAQANGRLPAGMDPALLVSSIIGLTMFPAAGAPVWNRLFDERVLTLQAIEAHALTMLNQALQLQPEPRL